MSHRPPPGESPAHRKRATARHVTPLLDREEYVEQAYFFRTLLDRMRDNLPVQDLMESIGHEVLATTKLPLAIKFLLGELRHSGGFAPAMAHLSHYFTAYQTFVMQQAEDDRGRLDMRIALAVLHKESSYRADSATPQGIFLYQFETICRNRLSYDQGLGAMAADPVYDEVWRKWILTVRRQVGLIDLADLIYVRSAYYWTRARRSAEMPAAQPDPEQAPLFGEKEGRIALANRRKDPLLLFAALQRHLSYPAVPRQEAPDTLPQLLPQLARRVERMEIRLKLLEEDQRGGFDLSKFYVRDRPASDSP